MPSKQKEFNSYYKRKFNKVKWFEPYIQPKILDEWNNQSIKPGMNLLDVGSGFSLDPIFFAINNVQVTALDFSENALKKLKQVATLYGARIQYLKQSIIRVPKRFFRKFDIITDNGCFHHIGLKDRKAYIDTVSNLIKPGGILYIRAISEYVPPSTDNKLKAYRISSDDFLEFSPYFKIMEMSLFDYILNPNGRQKMWFIKLQRRRVNGHSN